jgi:hypothetical protein
MANIFQSTRCFTLATYLTTVAFATVAICPPPLMAANDGLNLNDINFGIKIEKIYEKVKRAIDKGETNKIVGYMFDFKDEVEQYTGKKIDINHQIDQAQKEARAKGQKINDKYVKAIKKEFGKHEKKRKHRAVWFAQCAELDIPYSTYEADANFEMNYLMAKSVHKGKDKEEVQVEDVPVKIMVGVTITLCGLFLWFVPLPGCQTAGTWLINTGVGVLGSEALDRWDAYDKEQRNKKDK